MLFTSESVTTGHPDKICDQISDSILDALLAQDPQSKVAIDAWVKDNNVGLIGELSSNAHVDFEKITRETIKNIGYDRDELGFNGNNCNIQVMIGSQSNEINHAVVADNLEIGAGDQGLMFGMATRQTPELMPLPIQLAHRIAQRIETVRKELESKGDYTLRPDAKTQVTIKYSEDKKTIENIDTILISTQHSESATNDLINQIMLDSVIQPAITQMGIDKYYSKKTRNIINPSGSFVMGGPVADSGLTGRKIVVDGYGGWGRVRGGAFSGKDGTKVDRSAAYLARFLSKEIVKKGWANEVEIQLSYAIGVAEPTSFAVFGDLNKTEEFIIKQIKDNYDMRPKAIINQLNLNKPIFRQTSVYGHFGRENKDGYFSWE